MKIPNEDAVVLEATIEKSEPQSIRKISLSGLEERIQQRIQQCLAEGKSLSDLPYLADMPGPDAASTKLGNIVELLQNAKPEDLLTTTRAARMALEPIQRGVVSHEFACMMNCPCIAGDNKNEHFVWPDYTAGCFTVTSGDGTRFGGRLWDTIQLLKINRSNFTNIKPVIQTTMYALKGYIEELSGKERALARVVAKVTVATNAKINF